MLRVEDLDVSYRRTQVLFGVSMEVPAGGLVCVMGRNGVGKTTLLNTVMGVLPAGGGRVWWNDDDITRLKPHERVRRGIGYVPQGHATFPQLTVLSRVVLPTPLRPITHARPPAGTSMETPNSTWVRR